MLVWLGAIAVTAMIPVVALGAPTGHAAVSHAGSVFAGRAMPSRTTATNGGGTKVPFDVDVRPKPLGQSAEFSPLQRWGRWSARPIVLWSPGACFAGGTWGMPGTQASSAGEPPPTSFTIGSLAGDPSRSLFAASPSELAGMTPPSYAGIAGSNNGIGSASGISFQYQVEPAPCGSPF